MALNLSPGKIAIATPLSVAIAILNPASSAEAQTVTITSPANNTDLSSDNEITVTGTWHDVIAPSNSREIKIVIYEVDSSDNPIGTSPLKSETFVVGDESDFDWSKKIWTPAAPTGQSRKYMLRAMMILDDEDPPAASSTIYFRITVSGGPGGGGS